jgi:chemotaxis response regulator CheB
VGILLTGMGKDGANGLKTLRNSGALTITQDSESCVVYGMPRLP